MNQLKSHSVQIAYCVDCAGNLRIFVEHWHGTASINSTNMTISITIGTVTTVQTQTPNIGLINVPFGSLPGCSTPVTAAAGCPGQQNTYNDWVVYTYTGLPSSTPIAFTIISGNNAFTADGCGMYPLTVNFTIPPLTTTTTPVNVCSGAMTPPINIPVGTNWTNSNTGIGLAASGTGPIPPFMTSTPGTAVITYSTGCGSSSTSLTVVPSLTSSFTNNSGAGGVCLGTAIGFNNTSPVSTGWTWNFGDATTSNLQNPTHVYATPGTYTVSLTVTSGTSCAGTSTQVVTVNPIPVPAFTITPVCINTNMSIVNGSTIQAGTMAYQWTTAGGNPATSAVTNPVITYNTAGNYSVNLLLTSVAGCTATLTKTLTIHPTPSMSFSAAPVCKGLPTIFVNTSTVALPNTIANWFWDFNNDNVTDNTTFAPNNTFANDGVYPVELKGITNNGCRDSVLVNVTVHATPTVAFSTVNNCMNTPIVLNNTSSINAPSTLSVFAWSFGPAATPLTSTLTTPANLTYNTAGIKTITLTLTSNNNCTATATQTVQVYTSPTSTFNANPVCSGVISTFTDLSTPTGSITNWHWDFTSNGSVDATTQNPTNLYPASGNHSVTLITTSNNGCKDTLTKTISVFGRSVINFGPTAVCFNTPTAFTNSTSTTVNANTSAVASWSWNFGATAGSSTLMNPVYTYTNPANATANLTYSATLFATTIDGCKDSLTKVVTVYSLPTTNFVSDSVCLGAITSLSFTGNNNGNPLNLFIWDFDNNGTPDLTNTSQTATHVFPNFGNNAVSYTVTTSPDGILNCFTNITKNVWIHPIPNPIITHTNSCLDTQPLNISGINSNIAIGTVTNYAWNYGNGNSSLVNLTPATSFSYNAAGAYPITLTVTSNAGCVKTSNDTVHVWQRPYGHFSYSKTCFNKTTHLQGYQEAISGNIINYGWDYNNNVNSVEANGDSVAYVFTGVGTQTVNLLLTTDKGCKNIIPGTIYINYLPVPNFYAPKRAGCTDLCVSIGDSTALLTGPAKNVKWEWDFGNGQDYTSTVSNTNVACYNNTSNFILKHYDIKLIVRSDSGCVDSISKHSYITVYPKPRAAFDWKGEDGSILTPNIIFTNTSDGHNSSHWYFNDGVNVTDSSSSNLSHYFNTEEPRNYNVFLAVRNQYGCKDTTARLIEIDPYFTFYIPNAFTPNGDGVNDMFTGAGIGIKSFEMRIFDRWGEMLYFTNDIKKGWDGSVKGKYPEEKMDVYQYKVMVTDLKFKNHLYVGHVMILR